MHNEPMTMSLWPEAAQMIGGVGRDLIYRLAAQGQLPGAVRLGRKWRVSRPILVRALHEGWQPAELASSLPAQPQALKR